MRKTLPKCGPNGIPGLFLGYVLNTGGRWSGGYYVSPIVDWDDSKTTGKRVRVLKVKEIVFDPENIQFPMRKHADIEHRTIKTPKSDVQTDEVKDGDEKAAEKLAMRLKPGAKSKAPALDPVECEGLGESPDFGSVANPEATPDGADEPTNVGKDDYWEVCDDNYIFHHVNSRKALFTPRKVPGAPDPEGLAAERETKVNFDDGKGIVVTK